MYEQGFLYTPPFSLLTLNENVYEFQSIVLETGKTYEFKSVQFTYLGARSPNDLIGISTIQTDPLRFKDQVLWIKGKIDSGRVSVVAKPVPAGSGYVVKDLDTVSTPVLPIRDDNNVMSQSMLGQAFYLRGKIWLESSVGGYPITYFPWIIPTYLSPYAHPPVLDAPGTYDWKVQYRTAAVGTDLPSLPVLTEYLHLSVGGLPSPNADRRSYTLSTGTDVSGIAGTTSNLVGVYCGELNSSPSGFCLLVKISISTTTSGSVTRIITTSGSVTTIITTSTNIMTITTTIDLKWFSFRSLLPESLREYWFIILLMTASISLFVISRSCKHAEVE